jgi:nucleotide-binding universal stress UspA family protein
VSTILIGIDGSERSEDAIAFGRQLASVSSGDVIVACAGHCEDALHSARDMGDRLLGVSTDRVTVRVVADASPARALHDLAEAEHAAIVVVGSTHTGGLGRVAPGSTGERLLHGAPCAVAVVPGGYQSRAEDPIRRVGLAYDASEEARAAVTGAVELTRALDAELEVVGIVSTAGAAATMRGPSFRAMRKDLERSVQQGLASLMAGLGADVTATSHRLVGDPAELLSARTADLDLLLMGSRGYGPLRSVLVGGVSGAVTRGAQCPVIVVPRGVEAPLGTLFARTPAAV